MRPQITRYPDKPPLTSALIAFLSLATAALLIWLISAGLGGARILVDPAGWLLGLDEGGALDLVSNAAEVVAAVLGIAITVVAIVVELAANRYSHLITRLFMREPVNMIVLGLFLITTIQCVWFSISNGYGGFEAFVPHAAFFITLTLITLSLLCLLPYIYFVFTFLSPISVIERICANAVSAIGDGARPKVGPAQRMTLAAIDELQDVSRGAIEQGDRSIAISGINGLTAIVYDYAALRPKLAEGWFEISEVIAGDPDFIAMTEDALTQVAAEKIWLETKIFRQLNSLMSQSAGDARDVANLIGINTSQVARDLGPDNPELMRLCVKSFNSFLRTTINARDARTAYYLMDRYRAVAEHLLQSGDSWLATEIAGFFREYGQLGHLNGLSFLLDAAAYDVAGLIEYAVELHSDRVDELLDVLLELDDEIKEEKQEDSLLGVRRSQIQLATFFMEKGDQARVDRIISDLKSENTSRLERLRHQLLTDSRPHYWELIDRGSNFSYLDPARRHHLASLYEQLLA